MRQKRDKCLGEVLSQTLQEKWLTADVLEKRRILEIVFLNFSLDDVSLVPTIRKPFDILAEGPSVQSSRGGRTTIGLFLREVRTRSCHIAVLAKGLMATKDDSQSGGHSESDRG